MMRALCVQPLLSACLAMIAVGQGVLWWRVLYWYPQLPARFPIHFDFAGKPDGWANKSIATWFLLPVLSLVLIVFVGGIAIWLGVLVRTTPGIVNVPRKDLFLKLSIEGRMTVVAPTRVFLAWVLGLMAFLFVWIVEGTGRVAVHETAMLPTWPVFVFLAGVLGVLPIFYRRTGRMLECAARREGLLPPLERVG